MGKIRTKRNFEQTIKQLEEREEQKLKDGYYGDASELAYMRLSLLLLKEISEDLKNLKIKKPKRKPSAWSIFAGEQIKVGKSIQEASQMWRLKKK